MDQTGEHLVHVIDATAREAGQDNEQKAINHSIRALFNLKAIPDRIPGMPYYAVSIDPSRHWNTNQGNMPVAVRAQTGDSLVDTNVNKDVILCGDSIGYWRVPLKAGKADVTVKVDTFDPAGTGQLFVFDNEDPQRQGSTPTFTWSADEAEKATEPQKLKDPHPPATAAHAPKPKA